MERILSDPAIMPIVEAYGRETVKGILAEHLAQMRRDRPSEISMSAIAEGVRERLGGIARASLQRVVNGSGVMIHTNLGRCPIDPAIWEQAGRLVSGYSNLEYSLESGERGSRDGHVSELAARLYGCEAAVLTNNNAAGTLLLLAATAANREVIVSRGELVEIGGSFRIPEVIQQGGAILKEVGTTNRTRSDDYLQAAGRRTAAILLVKRSNFEIVGFTERPAVADLVGVARRKRLPLLYDEGSGLTVELSKYGFSKSQTIRELFAAGVDAVTCSTDKLLGATQGGLILGRRAIIEQCRRHPLMRALRAGKESYAVITMSLLAFLNETYERRIPLYRMLSAPLDELRRRAEAISAGSSAKLVEVRSALGGGTTPTETIPSVGIELAGNAFDLSRTMLARSVPIVGRIRDDRFTLDLRTILPEEDGVVRAAIGSC